MNIQSVKHAIVFATMVVTVIGMVVLFYMAVLDGVVVGRPLVMNAGLVQIERGEYKPGETVRGTFDFCKMRDITGTLQWSLVDTYMKVYPETTVGVPVGCHRVLMDIEKIPPDAYPSTYHFEGIVKYKVNGLNEVSIPLRTSSFVIKRVK